MEEKMSRAVILGSATRQIRLEDAVQQNHQLIDVRSPNEFLAGTIPGAVNIPLFDEDERSVIGTLYKHGGHEQAVDKGFTLVREKLQDLLAAFQSYADKPLTIFCARGGMRSLSVVNLLVQSGCKAHQLTGGYKKYRHDVLHCLENFQPKLIVIHGLTGTGKTRILHQLDNAIDLEDLAQHRSSLFGGLDRDPSNQRSFESNLVRVIGGLESEPYFIEGESRKIGKVYIPKPLAKAMKQAVLVNVYCSLETRIGRIIEDYPITDMTVLKRIESILLSLQQKMGKEKVERMCQLLQKGELHELVRILLVEYYDKRYSRSMKGYSFALEISSECIDTAAIRLTGFRDSLR